MRVAATPASSVVGIVAGVIGTLRLRAESRMEDPTMELVTLLLASKLRSVELAIPLSWPLKLYSRYDTEAALFSR